MPKPKKVNKDDEAPKKRGNQGDFKGKRLTWLEARVDEYRGHSANKTLQTADWWTGLWADYWQTFPDWRQPTDSDAPVPDLDLDGFVASQGASSESGAVPIGPETEDAATLKAREAMEKTAMEAKKTAKMAEIEAKIKRWFGYRRNSSKSGKNPFDKWLVQLKHLDDRQPKRLHDYQVYMQDEDNNARINEEFKDRYPDKVGARNSIKWRAQIARDLLEEEGEEIKEEYRKRAEEEHQEAMAEYKAGVTVEGESDVEVQRRARELLIPTVQPLLNALREITGYHLTLIAGTTKEGVVDVRSAHSGQTARGKDFTAWNPASYKNNIVNNFLLYLAEADVAPVGPAPSASAPPPPDPAPAPQPLKPTSTPVPSPAPAPPPLNPSSAPVPSPAPAGAPPPPNPAPAPAPAPLNPASASASASAPPTPQQEDSEAMDEDEDDVFGGLKVGSPLRRQVGGMEGEARDSRIWAIKRMSQYDRNREANIIGTREKLSELGIADDLKTLLDELRGTKRQAGEGSKGSARKTKRAKKKKGDDDDFEAESGEEDDDGPQDEDENEDPPRQPSPTPAAKHQTRGKGKKLGKAARTPQTSLTEDGTPKWGADARVRLQSGGGGVDWEYVVGAWWEAELAASFSGPAKGQSVSLRPPQVSKWVGRGRTGDPSPPLVDLYEFATQWWRWWCALNPEWRRGGGPTGGRLHRTDGDWGGTMQAGPNGFLNVLMCLRWWRDAIKSNEPQLVHAWDEAVADVRWAVQHTWKVPPAAEGGGAGTGTA
ncbi:hypothetical protein C8F04DRAFT_1267961 [Mycena alexandri]|uniref:Uncharacterized protein n=1 Tax=Mycena alexandri TaxID=1745969 RepID=A0AAD6SF98_9AGAR|nr:hypothetical protein C8F04DRAFT_1267961 [Mycena alexandri]